MKDEVTKGREVRVLEGWGREMERERERERVNDRSIPPTLQG